MTLALAGEDEARPEHGLGFVQDTKRPPPGRFRLAPRGDPDAEIHPEDTQVDQVGPDATLGFRASRPPRSCDEPAARAPGFLATTLEVTGHLVRQGADAEEEPHPIDEGVKLQGVPSPLGPME